MASLRRRTVEYLASAVAVALLLAGCSATGADDAMIVRAVEDASGQFATLQVNATDPGAPPSTPNWVSVAQIDGVHAGDAVNVMVDSHSAVHLAQIHVGLLV